MTLSKTIETKRLVLRPFTFDDVADTQAYCSSENFGLYLSTVPYPYTLKDAQEFIAGRILDDPNKTITYATTINNRPVGAISLHFKNSDNTVAEMGWALGNSHWGKGFTTEAVTALINTAFGEMPHLHKLYARADLKNVGSWRVMEKVSMRREANFRQHRMHRGAWSDEVWYAILRSEWENGSAKTGESS